MKEVSYNVEYKLKKNSSDILETEITFDLEDYMDSYSVNEFHLSQNYPQSIVDENIYPDKKDFLQQVINRQVGTDCFVSNKNFGYLINEVDADVDEYLEEIDYDYDDD